MACHLAIYVVLMFAVQQGAVRALVAPTSSPPAGKATKTKPGVQPTMLMANHVTMAENEWAHCMRARHAQRHALLSCIARPVRPVRLKSRAEPSHLVPGPILLPWVGGVLFLALQATFELAQRHAVYSCLAFASLGSSYYVMPATFPATALYSTLWDRPFGTPFKVAQASSSATAKVIATESAHGSAKGLTGGTPLGNADAYHDAGIGAAARAVWHLYLARMRVDVSGALTTIFQGSAGSHAASKGASKGASKVASTTGPCVGGTQSKSHGQHHRTMRGPPAPPRLDSDEERELARMSERVWKILHLREDADGDEEGDGPGVDEREIGAGPEKNDKSSKSETNDTPSKPGTNDKPSKYETNNKPVKLSSSNNRLRGYCDEDDEACLLEAQLGRAQFDEGEILVRMRAMAVSYASIIATTLFLAAGVMERSAS